MDQISANESKQVQLSSISIEGNNKKVLKTISSSTVAHLQVKGDYIYLSRGTYEESTGIYNGSIAKMKKDGTDFYSLTETGAEKFLVVERDGKDYLIYDSTTMVSSKPIHCSIDLSTNEISETEEFLPIPLNVPFLESKNKTLDLNNLTYFYNNVYHRFCYPYFKECNLSGGNIIFSVYTNYKGEILLDENNFKEISGRSYVSDKGYRAITNIEYTNDCVYFTIEEAVRSEEHDVLDRRSYKKLKTETYQKNLKTSQIRVIHSY